MSENTAGVPIELLAGENRGKRNDQGVTLLACAVVARNNLLAA